MAKNILDDFTNELSSILNNAEEDKNLSEEEEAYLKFKNESEAIESGTGIGTSSTLSPTRTTVPLEQVFSSYMLAFPDKTADEKMIELERLKLYYEPNAVDSFLRQQNVR